MTLGFDAHRYAARESTNSVTVKTAQTVQPLQEDLAFISTITYGLRGVITWPKAIQPPIGLQQRKRVARAFKKALEEVQGPLENEKKNWENIKKKMEDSKKNLEKSTASNFTGGGPPVKTGGLKPPPNLILTPSHCLDFSKTPL